MAITEGSKVIAAVDCEIFASTKSEKTIGELRKHQSVVAAGSVVDVDGYKMLPIKPRGAVQVDYLEGMRRRTTEDCFSELQEWVDQHRRLPLKHSKDKRERQLGRRLYGWKKALHDQRSELTDAQASTLTKWLGDVSLKDGAEARRRQIRAEQAIAGRAAMADEGLRRKCAENDKADMQDADKKRFCAASGAAAMQDADN